MERDDNLKERFLDIVSHELRTPLTIIKGYHSLLEKAISSRSPNPSDLRAYLNGARLGLRNMERIVNQLIDFIEARRGGIVPERKPFSFQMMLGAVHEAFSRIAEGKGQIFLYYCEEPLPTVTGMEGRLAEALAHLMDNAIVHTPTGGTIELRCWHEKGEIFLKLKDTGPGIPQRLLPFIFDPFFQVEDPLTRKTGGLGIGLSFTRDVIEDHGGTIAVESKEGVGTSFLVRLPLEWTSPRDLLHGKEETLAQLEAQAHRYAKEIEAIYQSQKKNEEMIHHLLEQMEEYARDLALLYEREKPARHDPSKTEGR